MTTITETKTESELQTVEQTKTIEKIKCDVCGHTYPKNEWCGNEYSVNPEIDREAHTVAELKDLFTAYHTEIPTHVIEDGYNGSEMNFDVPEKDFIEVFNEELPFLVDKSERSQKQRIVRAGEREKYAEMLGTRNFYIDDGSIHHFKYVVDADETTDEHKHVCTDCHEIIFE